MSEAPRARWSGHALLSVALWSASFVAVRIALESFEPLALVAARLLLGAAALALVARATGRRIVPRAGDRRVTLALGLVFGVHLLLQARGLETTTAIHAGWIVGFGAVPTALGARLFLGERLGTLGWLGVALASGGIAWILAATTPGFERAQEGDVLQVVACFTWAAYTLVGARAMRRSGALSVTVASMAVGAAALLAAAALRGEPLHAPATWRTGSALVVLGVLCSGVAVWSWNRAVEAHGAARIGSYLYLEPFGVLAVSWALLDEPVTPAVVGGGLLVLLGMWAVATGTRAARRAPRGPGERRAGRAPGGGEAPELS